MNERRAIEFLRAKPGYLKTNDVKLALMLEISEEEARIAKKAVKNELKEGIKLPKPIIYKSAKKAGKKRFKRLFFDIETSYNTVASWSIGYNLTVSHDNILKERAVICICYKWAGESKVHSLEWNKGDDKKMLVEFIKVLNSADEVIGHNSDRFDEKWIRTRCAFHGIPMFPSYQTVDTLKLAKSGFRFNSNRLDYLGKFFGFGGKKDTGGFKLWLDIVEHNSSKAMKTMVDYCKGDVCLLEHVYDKLNPYTKAKTHVGVALGKDKCTCPNCGGERTINRGYRYLVSGTRKKVMLCLDCGKGYTLPDRLKVE